MSKRLAYIYVILGAACWGLIGIFNRMLGAAGVSVWNRVTIRNFLSLVLLTAVFALIRRSVFRIQLRHLPIFMGAGLFALYMLFVYRSTLQGLGDTFLPMISGIVELFMRIGSALLLPLFMGEWGIYLSEIMAWAGAAVLLIWGYYRRIRLLSQRM